MSAILDSPFIAIVLLRDNQIVWANGAMHCIFGYEPDELIGQPSRRLFLDDESHEAFGRELRDVMAGNRTLALNYPQKRKDGTAGWYEFNVSRLKDDPDTAVAAVVDGTASHRIAQELEVSELRYRKVVEDQTEVISRFLPDGTFVFVNEVYCRLFGKTSEELVGHQWHPVVHPDDLAMVEARLREMSADRPIVVIENRVVVAGGDLRWMQFVNRGFYGPDGTLNEIQSVGRDITRLKEVEQALRVSDQLLATLETIGDGFIALDAEWRFVYMNGVAEQLLGLDRRQAIGRNHWDIFPDAVGTDIDTAYRKAAAGEAQDIEVPWGPGRHCFHSRSFPRIGGGISVYFVDITERKREQADAARNGEMLQNLARHQVATQTAAAFAHEINQPLMSIVAYNETALRLLSSGKGNHETLVNAIKRSHEQAVRAGSALSALIDSLQRKHLEPSPFDLNQLVEHVVRRTRTGHGEDFQATLDLEPGLPLVMGQRLQTEKVLDNLIRNGIEAMLGAGLNPAALAITARTHANHDMAHVTVRDSGPGLDAETARRVFEPLFTTKPNGLGLGLAISRALIEAQNGQLWLDPDDGPGAAFHFTLPFADR